MVRLSVIILLFAIVFFILAELPEYLPASKIWVREIFDKDFYTVYDDSIMGQLFHSKTFYMPNDSLVEYYWNGNYIIAGVNKMSDANEWSYDLDMRSDKLGIIKNI